MNSGGSSHPHGGFPIHPLRTTVDAPRNREQVGPLGAKLPLASHRKGLMVGPLPDSPATHAKPAGQVGIGLDAKGVLCVNLGDVFHMGAESRPLDRHKSSTLDPLSVTISPMDTFGGRLTRAMEVRGAEPKDLIRATGLSKAAIYFLLNGTTTQDKVRSTTVTKLCKALHISDLWLTQGRGSMDTLAHGEKVASEPRQVSQLLTLDEGTLWNAELIVTAKEAMAGEMPPKRRVRELARLYNVLATSGQLTDDEMAALEHGKPKRTSRPKRAG